MRLAYRNLVKGFVKNENSPVAFATISDGKNSVQTDSKGYYEIKAKSNKLTIEKQGFNPSFIDLTQYKSGAPVNIENVNLVTKDVRTSQSIKPGEMDMPAPTPEPTPKRNMKFLYIGIGIAVAIGGYMYYKKNKK